MPRKAKHTKEENIDTISNNFEGIDTGFAKREEMMHRLQYDTQVFRNKEIQKAFEAVDRKDFVSNDYKVEAYEDYPLPTLEKQTISQPTTVAFMLELLDPKKGNVVLDIGSGSGWTSALLGHLVGKEGKVYGVEIQPSLIEQSRKHLEKYKDLPVEIVQAEKQAGHYTKAPFDRILGGASFPNKETVPMELMFQLAVGGIMVIPIGESIFKFEKISDDDFYETEYPGFLFVPYVE